MVPDPAVVVRLEVTSVVVVATRLVVTSVVVVTTRLVVTAEELVAGEVADVRAGPVVVPLSTPEQVPDPGTRVLPPDQTVGPGTAYVLNVAWISHLIPGSVAAYAPGKFTSEGTAEPPPVTVIWTVHNNQLAV